MSMPGIWEMTIIFGVAILLFGGKKLPGLGSALGESIRNFKDGLKEVESKPATTVATPELEQKKPDGSNGGQA